MAARPSDLTADGAQAALGVLREAGRSLQTLIGHVASAKAFSGWLHRVARRTREDVLAGLAGYNAEADRRHVRRDLTPEESTRLVAAAEGGPTVGNLTGLDRAMLYRVALGTGYRADELRSLTPESFRLDREPPVIVCSARDTKNGEEATQPIGGPLAACLRPRLAGRRAGQPVFAMPPVPTARMIRGDLKRAGIPYQTDRGVADFHALRATYIIALVQGGASVKTLDPHSTPVLTIGRYARLSAHDQAAALT